MRTSWWKTGLAGLFTALMLFPLYWMINISFTQRRSIRLGHLFPVDFTFDHYLTVLREQLPFIGTSLVVGLGTVMLTLAVAAPAAFALSRLRVPGSKTLSFVLIVAQMVPAIVMSLGFYSIYNTLGLLDTLPGLILADSTIAVPFVVLLLTTFMQGIARDLTEAAAIDGASTWRIFYAIVLPISRNALITGALFSFLWAWSDFIFASTLNRGGGDLQPVTMGIYRYIGAQNQEWGAMMATAVVASIPAAILLIVAQKYIAAGITAGAVKD